MTELRDPNLPPGEIVEKREDGIWVRNDGVELSPAEKNPYFVMATICGEQGKGFDTELAAQNRRIWNGWACSKMSREARAKIAVQIAEPVEALDPLTPEEEALVKAELASRLEDAYGLPDPDRVDLSNTHFSQTLVWEKYVFDGLAYFNSAHFADIADFNSAHFDAYALFNSSHFDSSANFRSTHFDAYASFSDGAFGGETDFRDMRFTAGVPDFFQRQFHDNTKFTAEPENWPSVDPESAQDDQDAYRRLRQVSAQQQNPGNEHFFLRQEMACSGVDPAKTWLSRFIVRAFGALSDYGYGLWQPLTGLAATFVLGWLLIHCYFAWFFVMQLPPPGMEDVPRLKVIPGMLDALGIAVANTFSIFGFRTFYLGDDYMPHLPIFVKLVGGLQTVLGFVFLFFLGLGLRNRFRLK